MPDINPSVSGEAPATPVHDPSSARASSTCRSPESTAIRRTSDDRIGSTLAGGASGVLRRHRPADGARADHDEGHAQGRARRPGRQDGCKSFIPAATSARPTAGEAAPPASGTRSPAGRAGPSGLRSGPPWRTRWAAGRRPGDRLPDRPTGPSRWLNSRLPNMSKSPLVTISAVPTTPMRVRAMDGLVLPAVDAAPVGQGGQHERARTPGRTVAAPALLAGTDQLDEGLALPGRFRTFDGQGVGQHDRDPLLVQAAHRGAGAGGVVQRGDGRRVAGQRSSCRSRSRCRRSRPTAPGRCSAAGSRPHRQCRSARTSSRPLVSAWPASRSSSPGRKGVRAPATITTAQRASSSLRTGGGQPERLDVVGQSRAARRPASRRPGGSRRRGRARRDRR